MKKNLVGIIGLGIALSVCAFAAAQNELSGTNLPAYVRAALKQLNRNVPAAEKIRTEQLVVIEDIKQFFHDHGVTDQESQVVLSERQAFVLADTFPVYINVSHASFREAQEEFETNESLVTGLAAVLRHEAVHARGNSDELAGYSAEIDYIEAMQKKGKFRTPQATRYLAGLTTMRNRFLTGAEKNGPVLIKIKK